jgi:hypothetical protein
MYVPCVFNYSRKMYMYIYLEGISIKVLTQASLLYSYIYILSRQNIYTDTLYGHIKNEVLVKGELFLYINALGLKNVSVMNTLFQEDMWRY